MPRQVEFAFPRRSRRPCESIFIQAVLANPTSRSFTTSRSFIRKSLNQSIYGRKSTPGPSSDSFQRRRASSTICNILCGEVPSTTIRCATPPTGRYSWSPRLNTGVCPSLLKACSWRPKVSVISLLSLRVVHLALIPLSFACWKNASQSMYARTKASPSKIS